MKIQDQVYKVVDARLKRICAYEFKKAMGKRKTMPKCGIQYSSLVTDIVSLLNELSHCSSQRAEEIYTLVCTGEVNNKFEEAIS